MGPTIPNIVDQIDSFPFGKIELFCDKARVGREVVLNLASFPGNEAGFTSEAVSLLVDALQKAVARMEGTLGAVLNNQKAIFYMWHDKQAHLLNWTIISDVGQVRLPFSSNVNEVDIKAVVEEWAKPNDKPDLLSVAEIKRMTPDEWDKISRAIRAKGKPTINAFVRKVNPLLTERE